MRSLEAPACALLLTLAAASIAAADVRLSIHDGRISIVAKDATVGEILAEWARVGQARVVNAESLPRERVTIELQDVSEEHALDVLLRQAGGYIAAPRLIALPDASRFDRVLIMRRSVALVADNAARPGAAGASARGGARVDPAADPGATDQSTAEQGAADTSVTDQGAGDQSATEKGETGARDQPGTNGSPADQAARDRIAADVLAALEPARQAKARLLAADQAALDSPAATDQAASDAASRAPVVRVVSEPPARSLAAGQMAGRRATTAVLGTPRDPGFVHPRPAVNPDDVNGGGEEPVFAAPAVEPPPLDPAAQAAFKTRRAIETVNPRELNIPPQPPLRPAPAGAAQPGGGAPKPGVIVKQPGGPGVDETSAQDSQPRTTRASARAFSLVSADMLQIERT